MLPNLENLSAKEGSALATGIAGLLLAFKLWLKGRSDLRADGAGQSQADAYRDIIKDQDAHIERLEARLSGCEARANVLDEHLKAARIRINDEVNRRYIAESAQHRVESELIGAQSLVESLQAELQAARGQEP